MFDVSKSVGTDQGRYITEFGMRPSRDMSICKLFNEAGCICREKPLGKISATESEMYEDRVLCLLSSRVNKMAARQLRLPLSAMYKVLRNVLRSGS